MNRKTPRKSMQEIRLEERTRGFYDCLHIFETLWRENAAERMKQGFSMKTAFCGPVGDALWEGIEKAQSEISPDNANYRDIQYERVHGPESAVDQLAEVVRKETA